MLTSLNIEWGLDLRLSLKSRHKSLFSLAVPAGIRLQQPSHLSTGMCCCHEGSGDVAGPSFTAAAFSSFSLTAGNTVLATDSSQLPHHSQDGVLRARSGPEATAGISLRSGEHQLEGNPPDLFGAKPMAQ